MGAYFQLRFVDDHVSSLMGVAWIMHGDREISHDCGSMSELDSVISQLQRDLMKVRTQAHTRFKRKQAKLVKG